MQFIRGVEVQDGKRRADGAGRGALHDHFIADTDVPMRETVVRKLAIRAGFGHSVKVVPVVPGSRRETYYVTKYITKSLDQRHLVPWRADVVDVRTGELRAGEITLARYRPWSTSRQWGLTLGQARYCAWWRFAVLDQERRDQEIESGLSLLAGAFGADAGGLSPP